MHLKRLSKSWRNIFKPLFHLAGGTFLLLAVFFLPGRLIKINKVECESQYGACPENINSKLHDVVGYSTLNSKQIKILLKNNLLVSDYSIRYAFPDKLKVNILLKKARFAVFNKETKEYLLLDKNAQLLGRTNGTLLPVVIQNGDTPNLFALALMEGIFSMYQVNRGEIFNDSLVVELPTHVRVIFPLEGDRDILLGTLRLIYSEVTDKEIDLRFKNPILR